MSKNNLAARLKDKEDRIFNSGYDTGEQFTADIMDVAMHECGISPSVIYNVAQTAMKLKEECAGALEITRNAEADVWQEKIDARLKKIFGDKFQPWKERYGWLKEVRY